jgi:SNF2 family DNA or RNA helicase
MKTDADIASELPDKQETKVWLPLSDEQIILYDKEIKRIEAKIFENNSELKGLMLAALTRLKQICNHPELFEKNGDYYHLGGRSAKLDNLLQMVKTISSEGRKVLIFTQFVETAQLITRYLKQELMQDILLFYGGITIGQRRKIIEEFEISTNCPALVLSLRAGSLGLNLTAANYVIHYDRWWNPAVENQAVDRVHRLGQTRHTFIYKYICKGTLEEKIDKLIESKLALSDGIIPKGESVLTGLTPDTFMKIIKRS